MAVHRSFSSFRSSIIKMSTAFAGRWQTLPLELTPWILDVIQSMGHTQMTPVQASTIPLFMKNKDVVVEAVTGSGKTLAFVIPILERLLRRESKLRKNDIGALIISPTRELATQIHSIFNIFISSQPEDSSCLIPDPLLLVSSESSPAKDLEHFLSTGADIVIGTPGRVEELLLGKGRNVVNVKELEVLVLDEADRLLDLGFQASITRIITHLPKQRRTGLFSATMTDADALSELVRVGLRNPARIVVKVQSKRKGISDKKDVIEERRIPANLQNFFITCRSSEKLVQLVRLLRLETSHYSARQFIVYFATGACVDYYYKMLPSVLPKCFNLHSLHGGLPSNARTRALAAFSSTVSTPESPSVLLATDVAARGLDIPHVDAVIQFDPPTDPKAFSHRCGRTARAGRSGRAWVLLVGRESEYVDFMAVRKIPLKNHPFIGVDLKNMEATDSEDPEVSTYLSSVREFLLKDRMHYDLSVKAFVSFVKAYSKHEASYIFRVKDLDLVNLAKSYGLLRLPRMPELKNANLSDWNEAVVNWDQYAYQDKAQEAKRLSERKAPPTTEEIEKKKAQRTQQQRTNVAWSDKITKKEERDKRREKRGKKKQWLKVHATEGDVEANAGIKRKPISDEDGSDGEELAREERMAKKLRKGEVTKADFDAEFGEMD